MFFRKIQKCCRNCHFLAKSQWESNFDAGLSWNSKEREKLRIDQIFHNHVGCYKGVWFLGNEYTNDKLKTVLTEKRESCYFINYGTMTFQAANELEARYREDRQLESKQRLSKIAIGVSIISALIAIFALYRAW